MHIVWGVYRVFHIELAKNDMMSRTVIWSWYIGAIAGNIGAAYAIQILRKVVIYVRMNECGAEFGSKFASVSRPSQRLC